MKLLQHDKRAGSSAMFVIIGFALFIGLVSSVYFVKIRGNQIRKEQAVATYEEQKSKIAKTETKASDDLTKKTSEADSKKNTNDSADSAAANSSTKSNSVDLPATGPGLYMGQSIILGVLAMSVSSYLLSRRNSALHL